MSVPDFLGLAQLEFTAQRPGCSSKTFYRLFTAQGYHLWLFVGLFLHHFVKDSRNLIPIERLSNDYVFLLPNPFSLFNFTEQYLYI